MPVLGGHFDVFWAQQNFQFKEHLFKESALLINLLQMESGQLRSC